MPRIRPKIIQAPIMRQSQPIIPPGSRPQPVGPVRRIGPVGTLLPPPALPAGGTYPPPPPPVEEPPALPEPAVRVGLSAWFILSLMNCTAFIRALSKFLGPC